MVSFGNVLLKKFMAALGDELWDVHEQMVVAALDLNQPVLANRSLSSLKARFPNSVRVKRLEGMSKVGSPSPSNVSYIFISVSLMPLACSGSGR